jgi:putative flavoprotein involved in K+ transport
MVEHINTNIVGGGQVGLSTSYQLNHRGREHVILEHIDQSVKAWRERWDSFTTVPRIGLPSLHITKSGLLYGVGEDAAHVASAIDFLDKC